MMGSMVTLFSPSLHPPVKKELKTYLSALTVMSLRRTNRIHETWTPLKPVEFKWNNTHTHNQVTPAFLSPARLLILMIDLSSMSFSYFPELFVFLPFSPLMHSRCSFFYLSLCPWSGGITSLATVSYGNEQSGIIGFPCLTQIGYVRTHSPFIASCKNVSLERQVDGTFNKLNIIFF